MLQLLQFQQLLREEKAARQEEEKKVSEYAKWMEKGDLAYPA